MNDALVELVKAIAWPVAAVFAAVIFYRPIYRFLEAIGTRATKLSVFKVEVELLAGARPSASPSLEDIKNPEGALVGDSARNLFEQVQDESPADYALIDIGSGEEWLTSRLFIGAAMLERMRGVECLVFVGRVDGTDRKLLAVASLRRIRWALSQRQPWLEMAFAQAYAEAHFNIAVVPFPSVGSIQVNQMGQPKIKSLTGGLEPSVATNLVRRFIQLVQDTSAGTGPDWVSLSAARMERAEWVTTALLHQVLSADAFEMWTHEDRDKPRSDRAKAVLRRQAPFVALVNVDRQFTRLIDRRALLEKVATGMDE